MVLSKSAWIFIGAFFVMIFVVFVSIFIHEKIHKVIAKNYDCENVRIEWGLKKVVTKAECNLSEEAAADYRKLQAQNEIVGYYFIPFFSLISFFLSIRVFQSMTNLN